jgi:ribose transport system substrate-binding protein
MRIARQTAMIGFAIAAAWAAVIVPASADTAGKRIAVFLGPTQDKYLGGIGKGFSDAATAKGMKVTVFSSPFDPALEAQQIDDAIAQKYDMLVVQPISQKAIVPPLTRAKAAGIPVVLVVVPLTDESSQDLYVTYAGQDDRDYGRIAGEVMAKQLIDTGRSKANIAIIAGAMDEGKAPIRQKAFVDAIKAHPGLQVITTEDVKWNPVTAETSTGQLLAKYAGQGIAGIYGMNDTLANASIQAITAAGLTPGTKASDVVVVGGNCQSVGVENVKNGTMAATVYDSPAEEGQIAADKVAEYFAGGKLEKAYYNKPEPITAANIAQFAERCSY